MKTSLGQLSLILWHLGGSGDFQKKHLNARGFAWEFFSW